MPYPYQPYPYQTAYSYPPPMQDQLGQLRANQYQQPMTQPQAQAPALKLYDFVQGEAGAKGYLVAAGNTVLLLDSESERFYLKSTDTSGVPMPLRVFDYTERTAAQKAPSAAAAQEPHEEYVTRREFEAFKSGLRTEEAVPSPTVTAKRKVKEKEASEE